MIDGFDIGIGLTGFYKTIYNEFDKFVKKKIKKNKSIDIAYNSKSILYSELYRLNEFKFISITIIGKYNLISESPLKIEFNFTNESIKIDSDDSEIKTDYSEKSNIGITEFDVDLSDKLEHLIKKGELISIIINSKSGRFIKTKTKIEYNDIKSSNLKSLKIIDRT